MSADLTRLYTSLAADADATAVSLPAPQDLRQRGDRRARSRMVAGLLTVALVLGGLVVGAQALTSRQSAPPAPGASPTTDEPSASSASSAPQVAPPTSPPTSSAPAVDLTRIPDRAFLSRSDVGARDEPRAPPAGSQPTYNLCGARFASDGSRLARRSRDYQAFVTFTAGDPPQLWSYAQTITTYRPGGAAAFLAELRNAVASCPGEQESYGPVRYRLRPGPRYGDDSFFVERSFPAHGDAGEPAPGRMVLVQAVVRIGDVVTIVDDRGWESDSSSIPHLERFTRTAVTRLHAWLP